MKGFLKEVVNKLRDPKVFAAVAAYIPVVLQAFGYPLLPDQLKAFNDVLTGVLAIGGLLGIFYSPKKPQQEE